MTYSTDTAVTQLRGFSRWRTERVLEIMAAGDPDLLHGTLTLAAFSKETDFRNINGARYEVNGVPAEDKSLGQFSSYYNADWLAKQSGAEPGTYEAKWTPAQGGAKPLGRVVAFLEPQVKKWRSIMRYNITYARSRGVKEEDLVHVALAGYNRGIGNAINAYLRGDDPDAGTTGGNYGATVLARQVSIRRAVKRLKWG